MYCVISAVFCLIYMLFIHINEDIHHDLLSCSAYLTEQSLYGYHNSFRSSEPIRSIIDESTLADLCQGSVHSRTVHEQYESFSDE